MQLTRKILFLLFFPAAAFAQTTYSCPANQYVATQLVNTGQGCSALPTTVTNVSGATSGGFAVSTTSSGSTPVVSVAADGTHYMPTTSDQTSWNGKQAAGSYVTALTGDVTAVGPGSAAASVVKVNGGILPTSTAVVGTNSSGQIVAVPSQTAATILAAPSGAAGAPAFRALVATDVPTIPSSKVSGLVSSATTDTTNATNITSGTLPAAQLPTATTSALGAVKPDGTTITISSGVISSTGGGGGSAVGTVYQVRMTPIVLSTSSVTEWLGGTGVPSITNQPFYYFTAQKSGTIKAVEYATSQSAFINASCTFQIYDLTTSTVLAGTSTTNTLNNGATPVNFSVTGLSASVAAGDKLQVQIVMPAGLVSSTWQFNANVYME